MVNGSSGGKGTGGGGKLKVKSRSTRSAGGFVKVGAGGKSAESGPGVTSSRLSKDSGFNALTELEKIQFSRSLAGLNPEQIEGKLGQLFQPGFKFRDLQKGDDLALGQGTSQFDKSGPPFQGSREDLIAEAGGELQPQTKKEAQLIPEEGATARQSLSDIVGGEAPRLPTGGELGQDIAGNVEAVAVGATTAAVVLGFTSGTIPLTIGAAGLLASAVGTFPFAGFIKEEALQNLSFASSAATRNNDAKGLAEAIKLQTEILKTDNIEKITEKIPGVNIVVQLNDFFETSRVKLEIDKRNLEKLRAQL